MAKITKILQSKQNGMLLILDGCSEAKFSEAGTRLFAQIFATLEDYDKLEFFEKNVKTVFNKMISFYKSFYHDKESLQDFIMNNLLFTIIACFKQEDKYVVKMFGDGYIISQNILGDVSYLRFDYGKQPPYFAYKYCYFENNPYLQYDFKTYEFSKKDFLNVGIATDGIFAIAKGLVPGFDNALINDFKSCKALILTKRFLFSDDVTIAIFENGGNVVWEN